MYLLHRNNNNGVITHFFSLLQRSKILEQYELVVKWAFLFLF